MNYVLWAAAAATDVGAACNTDGGTGDTTAGGAAVRRAGTGATALPLILIYVGCDIATACEFSCSCLW